ncbi:hypothetical protein RUMCAL_01672, partial [Ruminococcus callidus ATCC 27760]
MLFILSRGFCSFHLPDTKKVHSAKAQQNARKSFIQFVQNHKNPNEFLRQYRTKIVR